MTDEAVQLIRDINRMTDTLTKLSYVPQNNPDIPHDHMLLMEGIESVKDGVNMIVNAILKQR